MSSNTGKAILARFRYPVTLTFVQFGYVALYCFASCFLRERLSAERRQWLEAYGQKPGWGITPATQQALRGTLAMSLFQIAGHVFSSMAIARVPVSTVHTIKVGRCARLRDASSDMRLQALSPLFTVASYALLFRVRYSSRTYLSLFPLTFGVMLACSFDLRANAVGFLCALGSTIIFVSQNIFSKKVRRVRSLADGLLTPQRTAATTRHDSLALCGAGRADEQARQAQPPPLQLRHGLSPHDPHLALHRRQPVLRAQDAALGTGDLDVLPRLTLYDQRDGPLCPKPPRLLHPRLLLARDLCVRPLLVASVRADAAQTRSLRSASASSSSASPSSPLDSRSTASSFLAWP
jgi:hypothetical protein